MAEALFNQRAKILEIPWRATSAGIMAEPAPLSYGALQALKNRGIELSGHIARQATTEMVSAANLVLCMTASQAMALERMLPGVSVSTLDEQDISDPYGATLRHYDFAAEQIDRCLDKLFQRLS